MVDLKITQLSNLATPLLTDIVSTQSFINSGSVGTPANFVETSLVGEFRGRYAGVGMTYDSGNNTFN